MTLVQSEVLDLESEEVEPVAQEQNPVRPRNGYLKWFTEVLPTGVPLTAEGVCLLLQERGHPAEIEQVRKALWNNSNKQRVKSNVIVRVGKGIFEYRPKDGTSRAATSAKALEARRQEVVPVQEDDIDVPIVKQIGFDMKARPLLQDKRGSLYVATPFNS